MNILKNPLHQIYLRKLLQGLGVFLCASIAIVSCRYLFNIGPLPELILSNLFYRPWLLVHVSAAATALLLGPFSFFTTAGSKRKIHKLIGRIYGMSCLIGAVTGFILALGASTGPITSVGFGLLAILWFVTMAMGWRTAMQRDFLRHRQWMIRSFALTLAAVTLRIYLPVLEALPISYVEGYRVISFLCWMPNLIAAEIYLNKRKNKLLRPQLYA